MDITPLAAWDELLGRFADRDAPPNTELHLSDSLTYNQRSARALSQARGRRRNR